MTSIVRTVPAPDLDDPGVPIPPGTPLYDDDHVVGRLNGVGVEYVIVWLDHGGHDVYVFAYGGSNPAGYRDGTPLHRVGTNLGLAEAVAAVGRRIAEEVENELGHYPGPAPAAPAVRHDLRGLSTAELAGLLEPDEGPVRDEMRRRVRAADDAAQAEHAKGRDLDDAVFAAERYGWPIPGAGTPGPDPIGEQANEVVEPVAEQGRTRGPVESNLDDLSDAEVIDAIEEAADEVLRSYADSDAEVASNAEVLAAGVAVASDRGLLRAARTMPAQGATMTAGELIGLLERLDADRPVIIADLDSWYLNAVALDVDEDAPAAVILTERYDTRQW